MQPVIDSVSPDRRVSTIAERLYPAFPSRGVVSWLVPIAVALIAGLIRFINLGRPHAVVFDEVYYAKDAWSLLRFGVEHQALDDISESLLAAGSNWREATAFTGEGSFVVHPPTGKWVIASGEYLFGVTPFGWRFAVAVLGTLSVLMIARIARRMTRSDLIGGIAGLLLALDGIHIVMSRTALLDMVLSTFVLAGFGFLVIDRDRTRKKMAELGAHLSAHLGDDHEAWQSIAGNQARFLGTLRPWRLAGIYFLALAVSVKWSALWFLGIFMILTLFWDVSTRRVIGVRHPYRATLLHSLPIAFISTIVITISVYLLSWTGWFFSSEGWGRGWAQANPDGPLGFLPDPIRSLADYHRQAWNFHVNLDSDHNYQSNPLSWPLMSRPTSFFYESIKDGSAGCDVDHCAQEVIALGNPIIWWAALLAIPYQLWHWITTRDWRSGAILAGIAAGWLPWMLYLDRTIFTFYTVAYVPFVVLAVAFTIMQLLQRKPPQEQRVIIGLVGLYLLAVVVAAWWFYPIWTGEVIPYSQWQLRMWLPTWV